MSLVRNEQTKLTASWLNSISAASIAVGGFAQLAPLFSRTVVAASATGTAAFTAVWFAIGFVLHVAGRMVLRRLEE